MDINVADRELGKKKKHKNKNNKQVSRQTFSRADFVGLLNRYSFNDVTLVEIKKTREVNCSASSKELNSISESSGAFCGFEDCACPIVSASLSEAEGLCIEESSNLDPCASILFDDCWYIPDVWTCHYPPDFWTSSCGREIEIGKCITKPNFFP